MNFGFYWEMASGNVSIRAPGICSHLFGVWVLAEVQEIAFLWDSCGRRFLEDVSIFNASLGSTVDTCSCDSHGGFWKNFRVFLREGGLWILSQSFFLDRAHRCRAR